MALPVAHGSFALGVTRSRDPWVVLLLLVLSVAPDFDFFFVWVLGLPLESFHRTFSHSILFAGVAACVFSFLRPRRWKEVSPAIVFMVLVSHGFLDLVCTLDPSHHGVMLLWPLSDTRWGWSVLVPIYQQFGDSPFSVEGALRFTALEMVLAVPLWLFGRACLEGRSWLESAFGETRKLLFREGSR